MNRSDRKTPVRATVTYDRLQRYQVGDSGVRLAAALANSGLLPTLGDPNLKAAAFHLNGAWVVVPGPASALFGQAVTVQNAAANGFESSPFWPDANGPLTAAKDITDATAPFVAAATAEQLLGSTFWSGDHTVYVVGLARTLTTATPGIFSHSSISVDGVYMQVASAASVAGRWNLGAGGQTVSAPVGGVLDEWSVMSLGRSGSNYFVRSNGQETTAAVTATAVNPSTRDLKFGRLDASGSPMRGPLACVLFYSAAHSSDQKKEIEARVFGSFATGGAGIVVPITTTRASAVRDLGAAEPENLLVQSEAFDQWNKRGACTVTANATNDPDGRPTADLISGVTGPAADDIYSNAGTSAPPAASVTLSLWLKRVSTSGVLRINEANGGSDGAWEVNLASLSDGWEQITASHPAVTVTTAMKTTSTGTFRLHFFRSSGAAPLSFYLAKAHARQTSQPSTYVKTGATNVVGGPFLYTAGDNARIAHPTKGLLAVENTTNLCLQSEDFSNASWGGSAVITANSTNAPDRTLTADTLNDNSAVTQLAKSQAFTVANDSVTRCASVYVKKTSGNAHFAAVQLVYSVGTGLDYRIVVNTNTGAVSATLGSPARAVVTDAGDYWRVELAGANNSTGNTTLTLNIYPSFNTTGTASGDVAAQGANVFWGAQLEANSFARPYVPTTTAAVTQTGDRHECATPTALQQQAGSFEFEIDYTPWGIAPAGGWLLDTRDPPTSGGGLIYFSGGNLAFNVNDGAVAGQVNSVGLTWNDGQKYRLKMIWNNTTKIITGYRDGSLVATSAPASSVNIASHGAVTKIGSNGAASRAEGHVAVVYMGALR